MRVIYGDDERPPSRDRPVQSNDDDELLNSVAAELDASLASPVKAAAVVAPAATPASGSRMQPRSAAPSNIADTDLDDLLDSIISVEQEKKTGLVTQCVMVVERRFTTSCSCSHFDLQ